ncbi:hypothetical protein [Pseudooceanicola spongiae]|uniref:Uncharacterized protein n=1 Tax=Pseudooceanicola spongiae TaxID=2613965 RepID=A0A7L9WJN5_9RHOB|nr:hypothetical protein [Pseudooceanicola spongiae]QOL80439.1 hypothetical protein F3W81_06195 [Pseudooceanicola spongiae]
MTPISSSEATVLDRTADGFRASASDIGEAIACLTGGVRPQPSDLSRLCGSMRALQTFLKFEADTLQVEEGISSNCQVAVSVTNSSGCEALSRALRSIRLRDPLPVREFHGGDCKPIVRERG